MRASIRIWGVRWWNGPRIDIPVHEMNGFLTKWIDKYECNLGAMDGWPVWETVYIGNGLEVVVRRGNATKSAWTDGPRFTWPNL